MKKLHYMLLSVMALNTTGLFCSEAEQKAELAALLAEPSTLEDLVTEENIQALAQRVRKAAEPYQQGLDQLERRAQQRAYERERLEALGIPGGGILPLRR